MKIAGLAIRQLLCEFLGTFLYIAIVLTAGIKVRRNKYDENTSNILQALANGMLVASLVAIFGHVSGAHINPAMTVGFYICKHIGLVKAVCYVIVQIVGALAGTAVAYVLAHPAIRDALESSKPYKNIKAAQVVSLEFLMTFVYVAVALAVVDSSRGNRGRGSAPLAIGAALTGCLCSCGSYIGFFNPAKCLGRAFISGNWQHHWVFWVGPLAGGAAAGLVYRFLLIIHKGTNEPPENNKPIAVSTV